MDAVTAFLNSEVDTPVYVELPAMWSENHKPVPADDVVCRLLRALYGLKQSPRLWQSKLSSTLYKLGFQPLKSDQCVYIKDSGIIIVTYVDDMLIIGKDLDAINHVKQSLAREFKIEDLGPAQYFLGVRITRDWKKGTISLCQDSYIQKMLERFGLSNYNAKATPFPSGAKEFLVPFIGTAPKEDIAIYQQYVGSLLYAIHTRADIALETGILSRYLKNPSPQHIKLALHVFQYLKGTITLGTTYGGGKPGSEEMQLKGYSDADHAGDIATSRSISGYVFFFAGGVISCHSKL